MIFPSSDSQLSTMDLQSHLGLLSERSDHRLRVRKTFFRRRFDKVGDYESDAQLACLTTTNCRTSYPTRYFTSDICAISSSSLAGLEALRGDSLPVRPNLSSVTHRRRRMRYLTRTKTTINATSMPMHQPATSPRPPLLLFIYQSHASLRQVK